MEMRSWFWTSLLAFGLTVGRVFAQDAVRPAPSASDVRVVRVRVVHTVGMCGGYGHCTAMTTISPSFIIRESKDSGDKQKISRQKNKAGGHEAGLGKLVAGYRQGITQSYSTTNGLPLVHRLARYMAGSQFERWDAYIGFLRSRKPARACRNVAS
jgi:hypothetical protein